MADTTTRFPPTKPHFFKPLITPNFRDEILIPMSFFIKYLDGQKCEKAVLRSGHGKVWPVNIINGRRIGDGWKEFVQDHDLHEGDFLVFRHEGNMVFDVMIFEPSACEREYPPFNFIDEVVKNEKSKAEKDSNGIGSKHIRKRKYTTGFEANATSSKRTANPSFVASLKPSYKRSRIMMIPTYFSTQYGLSINNGCREVILRDQKQRSWPVELRQKKGGNSFYFGPGWHEFCVANRLKEEDSFIFELIKTGNKPIMNFHCLEGNSMGKRETSSSKPKASSFEGLERSCMFKRETTSKPKNLSYTPGNSYFCGIIGRSHFTKYQMKLPKHFAQSNGLSDEECYKVILRNTNGGSWQVLLRHQKCDGQVYIGRGWNEFAVENGLEVGDKFKLELVKDGNVLIMNYFGLGGNAMAGREMTSNAKPSSSSPKNAYFCGVINLCNLTYSKMSIPKEFARSNDLTNKCCKMILRNKKGGGSWQVLLTYQKSDGLVYIGRGWNEFAVENGLEVGDEFKIELVKGGKMLIMNYYGSN